MTILSCLHSVSNSARIMFWRMHGFLYLKIARACPVCLFVIPVIYLLQGSCLGDTPLKDSDEAHPELKQNFISKNLKSLGFAKKQVRRLKL